MKQLKSLALAFTLAFATTDKAAAQTVPAFPVQGPQGENEYYEEPLYEDGEGETFGITRYAREQVARKKGVEEVYPLARKGFSRGLADTGENVGLEFTLNGPYATVVRVYDLDDEDSVRAFRQARKITAEVEKNLQQQYQQFPPYGPYPMPVYPPYPNPNHGQNNCNHQNDCGHDHDRRPRGGHHRPGRR